MQYNLTDYTLTFTFLKHLVQKVHHTQCPVQMVHYTRTQNSTDGKLYPHYTQCPVQMVHCTQCTVHIVHLYPMPSTDGTLYPYTKQHRW